MLLRCCYIFITFISFQLEKVINKFAFACWTIFYRFFRKEHSIAVDLWLCLYWSSVETGFTAWGFKFVSDIKQVIFLIHLRNWFKWLWDIAVTQPEVWPLTPADLHLWGYSWNTDASWLLEPETSWPGMNLQPTCVYGGQPPPFLLPWQRLTLCRLESVEPVSGLFSSWSFKVRPSWELLKPPQTVSSPSFFLFRSF